MDVPRRLRRGAACAFAGVLLLAPATGAGADPSPAVPSPSGAPGGASAAQKASDAAAARVARLQRDIAVAQRAVAAAQHAADAAAIALGNQLAVVDAAEQRSDEVRAEAIRAQRVYDAAHRIFVAYVTVAYEEGDGSGSLGSLTDLLAAQNPNELVSTQEDRAVLAAQQGDAIEQDRRAAAVLAAARTRAAEALAEATDAADALRTLSDAAQAKVDGAAAAVRGLHTRLVAAQVSQAQAEAVLSQFLGGWSVADPARADALNRHYLALAKQNIGKPAGPAMSAVWRALLQIGTPYAWAGGNEHGATRGVCAGGGAEHDCQVVGFDCSGLALFAWAPRMSLPHLASAQYTAAGSVHPPVTALQPGDLVFWSTDGTVGGIHHVALYVGDGDVVQAPQSGDIVRVTPLGSVDSGYFGATRPAVG